MFAKENIKVFLREFICLASEFREHPSRMTKIGSRIHTRRQALGWTLDRLAKETDVSKGFLSDLENGKKKTAGGDYLKRIAEALGLTLDHLISGTPIAQADDDIQIPASLATFARSENLTFSQTLMMLKLRQQVVAFRSETGADDFDWKPFYEAEKPYLK